ncbi:unnamed protein product [Notodromas monacha]|uniref:Pre-mRNA-splicing factor SPF27 n=1 Tax=Notodromas monacha TaxID=399045 RepID=A0A7R9BHY0_9CRUS|nr:unnamed protein product [Notodromas monacha]CAG0915813.1 unnamed protein product [Notodromas monacha]
MLVDNSVDALAYIDHDLDEPGARETVMRMIEEEKKQYRPTKNYLEHLPPLNLSAFETPIMKAEFERIANRLPFEKLSMKRYDLPPPPAGKLSDVQAWAECVDNSSAQLEHQFVRLANIEVLLERGPQSWQLYNETLVRMLSSAQKQLTKLREKVQEVNFSRKSQQKRVGDELAEMNSKWIGLVSKNYEIEVAITKLEADLRLLGETPITQSEAEANSNEF